MQTCTLFWARRISAIIFSFLPTTVFSSSYDDNESVTGNPIIIGQSGDLSGTYAHLTRQFLSGANVYFAQLNTKSGIHGRHVRLLTMDDKNDPELAVKNTHQLLQTHKAIALFGYVSAKTSTAVLPIISEQKVPYFAPLTGSRPLYAPFNRHIFTIRASYVNEYDYLLSRFSQIGLRRLAIFNDTAGMPHRAMMQTMITGANAQLVAFESGLGIDLDKTADNLIRSKPDIIMFMSITQDINGALIKVLRTKGYSGYFYCASLVCPPVFTNDLQEAANGLIISQVVPYPWKAATPIVSEYQKAMTKAGIKKFGYLSLEGYIAAKILAEGLVRAGPKLTREKLIAALESVNEKNYSNEGFQINFSNTNHHGSVYVDMTSIGKTGNILH